MRVARVGAVHFLSVVKYLLTKVTTSYDSQRITPGRRKVDIRGVAKFPRKRPNFSLNMSTYCTNVCRKRLLVTNKYGFPRAPTTRKKGGGFCRNVCTTSTSTSSIFI